MGSLLAVMLLSAPGHDTLAAAEKFYDDFEFDKAIVAFDRLLKKDKLKDAMQRQRARQLLGFSLYIRGREAEAKKALARLFAENADCEIDRKGTNPDVLLFFDRERDLYLRSLAPVKSAPSPEVSATPPASVPSSQSETIHAGPSAEQRPAETAVVAGERSPQSLGDRHPWLRVFPLGIGHFVNGDALGGGLFLGAELALAATNIAAAVVNGSMRTPAGLYRAGTSPVPWRIVQNIAAGALIVTVVMDVIDAFLWSPARGRARPVASLGPLGDFSLSFAGVQ